MNISSMNMTIKIIILAGISLVLCSCTERSWNNPYPIEDDSRNIAYSYFDERPKHLDPVRSYSENEYVIHGQIHEPPLQYNYFKRPFELEPLTAVRMPELAFEDKNGKRLPDDAPDGDIAYSVYTIEIKPGIRYQPHPAFAKNDNGDYYYQSLSSDDLKSIQALSDFKQTGTRELVAADYVYEIKRMAHPGLSSPIYSIMADYIVGLKAYAELLKQEYKKRSGNQTVNSYLDLHAYPLAGVKTLDRYTYQIRIKGKYPQILYWLAMPFFAPIPDEVDKFYSQKGMKERNLVMDWYPVGTGAYMLSENNPNRRMVLEKNPNFRLDLYPTEGEKGDAEKGLLVDAGKPMPFIDKIVYVLEKETIPYWNKFLQGYYDASGISSDSFDQAIQFGVAGDVNLTREMQEKKIKLLTSIETTTFYMGFNMLDPVVGGDGERARKLRQAIAIAMDYEDMISIFRNGRGVASQGPIPPGIFGHREGVSGYNPYVYKVESGELKRRSLEDAKKLMADAGYPNGRDEKTGKPLLLHFDTTGAGSDQKSLWDWYKKQFKKIDIQLIIRNTDYNRFQSKVRTGNIQLYALGWNADYPDPENFLFLLYGPNGKVKYHGENASNYNNEEFNRLFEKMKNMTNTSERLKIIDRMLEIARYDSPWLWGFHPKKFVLLHDWYKNKKLGKLVQNGLKYARIDTNKRQQMRQEWNHPVVWPVWLMITIFVLAIVPATIGYRNKERRSMSGKN